MSKPITLFSDYHKLENQVTNYCGLMIKLVYQESPKLLNRFFELLFAGKPLIPFAGPVFRQQQKKNKSIPDLEIKQNSFQILVETKLHGQFIDSQIMNHANGFDSKVDIKILILLTDEHLSTTRSVLISNIEQTLGVYVIELTFDDLIRFLSDVCLTESLREYLSEFEEYLDQHTLLPRWKYLLDVVNCTQTMNEVQGDLVYMCPDWGGQYSHRRAQYFGAYMKKVVNHVYVIDAVVSVDVNFSTSSIKWNNTGNNPRHLIRRAINAIKKYRSLEIQRNAIQVFLLSCDRSVVFTKDTKGGLWGSKTYFSVNSAKNIDDCAKFIDGKVWSAF